MDWTERWEMIEQLGSGGQGKVYRVFNKNDFNLDELRKDASFALATLTGAHPVEEKRMEFNRLRKVIGALRKLDESENHGALKILHQPEDARDAERALARIEKEIKALSQISHPNVVKLLDKDPSNTWYVSKFYPLGSVAREDGGLFIGDVPSALRALRPLVDGVATLHRANLVHRDIKPENVYMDEQGRLVLGDFGLVYFTDDKRSRLSAQFENVGSRDWMPEWAYSRRIEDLTPAFDVFSLGKLLWALISKVPVFPTWRFKDPVYEQFNLENMFPANPLMRQLNQLLARCVVEYEKDCLRDANALLCLLDEFLERIDAHIDLIGFNERMRCKLCGKGDYEIVVYGAKKEAPEAWGLRLGERSFIVLWCHECGNVQICAEKPVARVPAWRTKQTEDK